MWRDVFDGGDGDWDWDRVIYLELWFDCRFSLLLGHGGLDLVS